MTGGTVAARFVIACASRAGLMNSRSCQSGRTELWAIRGRRATFGLGVEGEFPPQSAGLSKRLLPTQSLTIAVLVAFLHSGRL